LQNPHEDEDSIILKSINNVNLPKFLSDDLILFTDITSDLFPNVNIVPTNYEEFTNILKINLSSMKLEYNNLYIERIIQIYEMILVRHGLMIIGDTISGKTGSYKVLSIALSKMSELKINEQSKVKLIN
jgi:dynein heavy chain